MATPPTFSVGQVLTAAHMNAVGMWEIASQSVVTSGSPSEVSISNCFSADYDVYRVTVSGGAGSAGMFLRLQLGATATGYYTAYNGVTYSTGAASLSADNNAANFSAVGIATTTSINLDVTLINPFLTEHTYISGAHADATVGRNFAGYLNNSTSYTGFKIICSTGSLSAGTIRVYGIRN
jgi:hypothetical protein